MQPRVGVDEAGKGPVLGAMFAGAVRVDGPDVLPQGLADSKDLAPGRREELDGALRERDGIAVAVARVPVDRIDDPATDMNTLTVDGHADAVAGVASDGDGVLADAGDTSASRFADRLAERVDETVDVTAEHGADAAHDVVSAASVVAKVARDAHVDALAEEHAGLVDAHGSLGSGYPSDPTTRSFLESYVDAEGRAPPFARSSWSTVDDLLATVEQSGIGEF